MKLAHVLTSGHFLWLAVIVAVVSVVLWEGLVKPVLTLTSLSMGCSVVNLTAGQVRIVAIDPNADRFLHADVPAGKTKRASFRIEGESASLVASYRYGLLVLTERGDLIMNRFGTFEEIQAIDEVQITVLSGKPQAEVKIRESVGGPR